MMVINNAWGVVSQIVGMSVLLVGGFIGAMCGIYEVDTYLKKQNKRKIIRNKGKRIMNVLKEVG